MLGDSCSLFKEENILVWGLWIAVSEKRLTKSLLKDAHGVSLHNFKIVDLNYGWLRKNHMTLLFGAQLVHFLCFI